MIIFLIFDVFFFLVLLNKIISRDGLMQLYFFSTKQKGYVKYNGGKIMYCKMEDDK